MSVGIPKYTPVGSLGSPYAEPNPNQILGSRSVAQRRLQSLHSYISSHSCRCGSQLSRSLRTFLNQKTWTVIWCLAGGEDMLNEACPCEAPYLEPNHTKYLSRGNMQIVNTPASGPGGPRRAMLLTPRRSPKMATRSMPPSSQPSWTTFEATGTWDHMGHTMASHYSLAICFRLRSRVR